MTVFRAFNPWRTIGRTVGWLPRSVARSELPAPLAYPRQLGRWPAAAGIFAFAVVELVASNGDEPRSLAIATIVYSALTFVAMALYGVERWLDRGEAFSVNFNLFSRISAFETRDGEVGLREPLSGLARLEQLPGTVALLAVMMGSVTFDGAAEAPLWTGLVPDIAGFFEDIGLSQRRALEVTFLVGLVGAIMLVPLAPIPGECMMLPMAHAGHWLTTIAYFLPVVAFLVWLAVTQIREQRGRGRGPNQKADD